MKEEVLRARARLGLTQKEFAYILGVSTPTVQRWEYGTTIPVLLQASIIQEINNKWGRIEDLEKTRKIHISKYLRDTALKHRRSIATYNLLKILFDPG